MNNRWIGSIAGCIFVLALSTHSTAAKLSEGNFIPFSQTVASLADGQVNLYRIEKGDTLYSISRQCNVNLDSLMLANNMNETTILEIGDKLKIPDEQGSVHVISPGDTINKLADRYQVSADALISANPNKDPNCLEVGDYLKIPAPDSNRLADSAAQPSRGLSRLVALNWPVIGTISSAYGWRKSGYHHGLDIADPMGTPIHAAAAGTVSWAGYISVYGRTVIIDHPDGIQTLYAHAQDIYVEEGEKVKKGQVISSIGMSGSTTGPHVHFEVRIDDKTHDPMDYLR